MKHDPPSRTGRSTIGPGAEDLHVLGRSAVIACGEMGGAHFVEDQVGWVDDGIDAIELAEFAKFGRGARSLDRPAPSDDMHCRERRVAQRIEARD